MGIAHPPTKLKTPKYVTNDFTEEQVRRMDLSGLPILFNHSKEGSGLVIGNILQSMYFDTTGVLFVGYVNLSSQIGWLVYETFIKRKKTIQFSMSHAFFGENDPDTGKIISQTKLLLEVSFVKKGNRAGCDLLFGMTCEELEKKISGNYIFEKLFPSLIVSSVKSRKPKPVIFDNSIMSQQPPQQQNNVGSTQGQPNAPVPTQQATQGATPARNEPNNQGAGNDQQTKTLAAAAPEGSSIPFSNEQLLSMSKEELASAVLQSAMSVEKLRQENGSLTEANSMLNEQLDQDMNTFAQNILQSFQKMKPGASNPTENKSFVDSLNDIYGKQDLQGKRSFNKVFKTLSDNTASAAYMIEMNEAKYQNHNASGRIAPPNESEASRRVLDYLRIGPGPVRSGFNDRFNDRVNPYNQGRPSSESNTDQGQYNEQRLIGTRGEGVRMDSNQAPQNGGYRTQIIQQPQLQPLQQPIRQQPIQTQNQPQQQQNQPQPVQNNNYESSIPKEVGDPFFNAAVRDPEGFASMIKGNGGDMNPMLMVRKFLNQK